VSEVDPPNPADRYIAPRPLTKDDPHYDGHYRYLPWFLDFTIGWGNWFGNRWSGVNDRWEWVQTRRFAYRTRSSYRRT
jgi:hypothetical protein